MKIIKKTEIALCIIVPIFVLLALITGFILYINQKLNFSKYHSYAVMFFDEEIPITDEQFQRIVDVYENDETLYYELFEAFRDGFTIRLYKTKDMSGKYDIMWTGGRESYVLKIDRQNNNGTWSEKAWRYKNKDTMNQVTEFIFELIDQYESEQEV